MSSQLKQPHSLPASERILAAIADRDGVDPLDFDSPLYEAVDPDALNALFESEKMTGEVSFPYLGYTVTAHSDGDVTLTPIDE